LFFFKHKAERISLLRNTGRLQLGYYPLPIGEAKRLKEYLCFPIETFSAIDPCVGNGVAFSHLLEGKIAKRYGIELDANRAIEAESLGIEMWQADALEMRCPAESLSLLFLNPPYDFEVGPSGSNKRMELVFLKHTCRWVKRGGVLVFVIPQVRLKDCARTLVEHFTDIRVYRLSEPECVRFNQIAVLAARRRRDDRLGDGALSQLTRAVEELAAQRSLPNLSENPEVQYPVPASEPVILKHDGIPLDELENVLLTSAAYRQLSLALLHRCEEVKGRPITPLHGGHVGLLCTAGLLDGVFGDGDERHIARWRSTKYVDHWVEESDDGSKAIHDCEQFSQEVTLLYANGHTAVLTHEKKTPSC
jgi:hypothetical protein